MNEMKPLNQVSSTCVFAHNHTSKLQNKFNKKATILSRLMDFAHSISDFRRLNKGNIRHRLSDIIVLIILAQMTKDVGKPIVN